MLLALLLAGTLTGSMSGARTSPAARPAPSYLSIGTVSPTGLPSTNVCSQVVPGRVCYTVTTSVPGLENIDAEVRVAAKTAGSAAGTIILIAGTQGDTFLAGASGTALNTSIDTYLLANGFQTVEIRFKNPVARSETGWTVAANGTSSGPMVLAARVATMIAWTNTNLLTASRLCAGGNSMGTSALWYAAADYGQHTLLSNMVLSSGPVAAVIDRLCSETPLVGNCIRQSWYGGAVSGKQNVFDQSYGYFVGDTNGPCTSNNASYRAQFVTDGNEHDAGALSFPNTRVDFIFGDLDSMPCSSGGDLTNARWRGVWMYNRASYLGQSAAGGLSVYTFPDGSGIGHTVHATATGADKFTQTIRDDCKAWP